MKIFIRRFGPLASFEFDLSKDIIVTYGDNNIGKSYAMQIVYLLLKNLNDYIDPNSFFDGHYRFGYRRHIGTPDMIDMIRTKVSAFAETTQDKTDLTKTINSCIQFELGESLVSGFLKSCRNTFGNFNGILKQKPQIVLTIGELTIEFHLADKNSMQSKIYDYPTFLCRASSDFHKSRNVNGHLYIYYYNNIETTVSTITDTINERMTRLFTELSAQIGNVFFLPASRSGIYSGMSAFSSVIAELSKSRALLTRKIELPGISEPISDYFLLLSNISNTQPHSRGALSDICKAMEESILKGKIGIKKDGSTLVYTPADVGHEFEMTEVSSMVSEISPIVAFLKYIVSVPGDDRRPDTKPIIFIEEPEAHLHPRNQILLISLLSRLPELGVKIVISSHSNYIFNKLNNLLLEKTVTPQIYSPILLKAENGGSVSVYMNIDELGVEDTNFLDPAEQLYHERERLIEEWRPL